MTDVKLVADLAQKKMNVPRVNLCDITREPTDEELTKLMNCVKQKAITTQEKAALELQAKLQQGIKKARESYVKPR